MKKLTAVYIFGAGASFGALPIINEFSHALEAIKFCPDDKIPYLKPFRESLDKGYYLKINSILEQFESPDNYARWLFLSGQAYDPNKNAETIQYKKIKSLYLNILYFLTYHQREIRGHLYSEPVISGNKIPNVALKNARDNQKNKILPYFNNKKNTFNYLFTLAKKT